jgi:hypothetical protein
MPAPRAPWEVLVIGAGAPGWLALPPCAAQAGAHWCSRLASASGGAYGPIAAWRRTPSSSAPSSSTAIGPAPGPTSRRRPRDAGVAQARREPGARRARRPADRLGRHGAAARGRPGLRPHPNHGAGRRPGDSERVVRRLPRARRSSMRASVASCTAPSPTPAATRPSACRPGTSWPAWPTSATAIATLACQAATTACSTRRGRGPRHPPRRSGAQGGVRAPRRRSAGARGARRRRHGRRAAGGGDAAGRRAARGDVAFEPGLEALKGDALRGSPWGR